MKKLFLILFFMSASISMLAQSLEITEINTSNYPEIRVGFVAKDANGKEYRTNTTPQLSEVKVFEGGVQKTINIYCAPPEQTKFSLIFLLDLSQSMSEGSVDKTKPPSPTNPRKTDLVIKAASNAIRALPSKNRWEAAVMGFNCDVNVFMQFTNDTNLVKLGIDSAYRALGGGTDYNAAFMFSDLKNQDGALFYAKKKAKNKPIIIFLTDGAHNPCGSNNSRNPAARINVWVTPISDEATLDNVTIFTLTLGLPMPGELQSISNGSPPSGKLGGMDKWFDQILSEGDLRGIFQTILQTIGTIGDTPPCELIWNTNCGGGGTLRVEVPQLGVSADTTFTIPDNLKPRLEIRTNPVSFSNTPPGVPKTQSVTLTARNNYVIVDGLQSSDPKFTVTDFPGQIRIGKDTTRTFTVQYLTPDSNYTKAWFTATGPSACYRDTITLQGGWLRLKDVKCGASQLAKPKTVNATAVICNETGLPQLIKNMVIKGGNFNDFKIINSPNGKTLDPGMCIDIDFTFKPGALDDRKSTIEVTDGNDNVFTSTIDGNGSGNPEISALNTVDFQNVNCAAKSKTIIIDIKNTGARTLIIDPMPVITPPGEFVLQTPPNYPLSIDTGQTAQLTVIFQPISNSGPKTANMAITSNAGTTPLFNITLNGVKDSVGFTTSATDVNFGKVCPNEQKTMNLTLTNVGTVDVNINGTDAAPFTLPVKTWKVPTAGPQTIDINLTAPATEGQLNKPITFTDDCGVTHTINLIAIVEKPKIQQVSTTFTTTVGQAKEEVIQICNTSSRQLTISNAVVPDNQFTIVSPPRPWVIDSGKCIDVRVSYLPTTPIVGTTYLLMTGTPCAFKDSVTLIGNPSKATADIQIKTTYTGYVGQIVNINLELNNPFKVVESGATQFSTLISWNPLILKYLSTTPAVNVTPANGSIQINAATLSGLAGTLVIINYEVLDGGGSTSTPLTIANTVSIGGQVLFKEIPGLFTLNPSSAMLQIDDFSGSAGQELNVPIKMLNASNINSFHGSIKTQLVFDASLLEPTDPSAVDKGTGTDGMRTIELSNMSVNPGPDNVIYTTKFKAMLGRAESSQVIIKDPAVAVGKANFTVKDPVTKFTLTQVCKNGGDRLFDPTSGKSQFIQLSPNPNNGMVEIKYQTIEEGKTKLYLIDMLGTKVAEINNEYLLPGEHINNYDCSLISTGRYLLVMQTPTQFITSWMDVIK